MAAEFVSVEKNLMENSQNGSGECWNKLCCYNGHLAQPHSSAVSISSEYEAPSLQRNTTFRFLLLVTPQQTPGGAAAWQDLGQSMRGILLVDVHVLKGWCRFSCSLTISPWQVNPVSQVGPVKPG